MRGKLGEEAIFNLICENFGVPIDLINNENI